MDKLKERIEKLKERIEKFKEWETFGYGLAIGCVLGISLVTILLIII